MKVSTKRCLDHYMSVASKGISKSNMISLRDEMTKQFNITLIPNHNPYSPILSLTVDCERTFAVIEPIYLHIY